MREFTYTITDPEGIHARPAGAFVKEAAQFPCTVTIAKDGKEVDAKRILGVMGLGEKEEEAMEHLSTFLKENL